MLLFTDTNSNAVVGDEENDDNGTTSRMKANNLFQKLSEILSKNNLKHSVNEAEATLVPSPATNVENVYTDDNDESSQSPYYIYRSRCQMEDGWGTIGLNCTTDDIEVERVAVIGFIINWMRAYIHIKREFVKV